MKNKDPINEYFSKRGINVSYNTLNGTQDLVIAYVNQFEGKVKKIKTEKSQHIKHACYAEIYPLEARQKYTGFEKFKKIDIEFRKNISPLVNTLQWSPTLIVDTRYQNNTNDYKTLLKEYVKSFKNPLLYLSGGLDSELVGTAMIDAGVKFTPVIFNYVDNKNQHYNLFDNSYAFNFCLKHGLYPILKTINIEELWSSKHFAELALELQITSPHLLTHAFMVETMSNDFSDATHVFGGEVRFYTHHTLDDGTPASLVSLAKNDPVGYSGQTYTATSYNGVYSEQRMDYTFGLGLGNVNTFDIYQTVDVGTGTTSGSPLSGTWATSSTIIQSYFDIRCAGISSNVFPNDGSLTIVTPNTTGSFVQIPVGANQAVYNWADASVSSNASALTTWTLELRNQASPQSTVTSTITFNTYSYNTAPP